MAKTGTFKGYSTRRGLNPIYDVALVNQDLLNHINTRKGEKRNDPEFGSIVQDLLFELKTPNMVADIQADLTRIIEMEPRVTLQKIEIFEVEYGYVGNLVIYYNQFATTQQLKIKFDESTGTAALG